MNKEELSLYFKYDDKVSTCLVRNCDVFSGRNYSRISAKKGDIVGTKIYQGSNGKPSALKVKFKSRSVMCHHIVWILNFGEIPRGFVVDHIDRNPFNNRISNLRLVRPDVNNQNRSLQSNNQTGVTGVYWSEQRGHTACKALVVYKGKKYNRSFSCNIYGLLPSFKLAYEWRLEKLSHLNSIGADFTITHGM